MNFEKSQLIEEASRRFNFMCNYDPSNPSNYTPTPTLLEIKGADKTVFTYDILKEMREGKISSTHPLFKIMPHVKDILLTEAYDTFSEFMSKLKTDKYSLLNGDNIIRKTYNNFKNNIPQRWKLIDPDEYLRCIQEYSFFEPQSGAYDDYWSRKIIDWVAGAKDNIAQFAANSYLYSGPTLDQTETNGKDQNLLAILWYNLTGDESIPYQPGECSDEYGESQKEREFYENYITKFRSYINTKFGDVAESTETDSPLDGIFNIVAAFDKNYSNFKNMFVVLDRLKNMCHGRGGLGHLIMKGGNAACEKICNSQIYNKWIR